MFPSNPVDGQPYANRWVYNASLNTWVRKKTSIRILQTGQVCDWDQYFPSGGLTIGTIFATFNRWFGHQFFSFPNQYNQCWFRLRRWGPDASTYNEFFKKGFSDLTDLATWVNSLLLYNNNLSQCLAMLDLIEVVDYELEPPNIVPINVGFSMLVGKGSCKHDGSAFCGDNPDDQVRYPNFKSLATSLFNYFWGVDVSSFSEDQLRKCLWVPVSKSMKLGSIAYPPQYYNSVTESRAGRRSTYDSVNNTIINVLSGSISYSFGEFCYVLLGLSYPWNFTLADICPGYGPNLESFTGYSNLAGEGTYISTIRAYPMVSGSGGRYKAIYLKPHTVDGLLFDQSLNSDDFSVVARFENDKQTPSRYELNIKSWFDGKHRSQPVPIGKFIYDGYKRTPQSITPMNCAASFTLRRVLFCKKDNSTYYVSPYSKKYLKGVFRTSDKISQWVLAG